MRELRADCKLAIERLQRLQRLLIEEQPYAEEMLSVLPADKFCVAVTLLCMHKWDNMWQRFVMYVL